MSLINVRPFFREKLEGLGFQEWRDSVEFPENIPETMLDKVFHIGGSNINITGPAEQIQRFNLRCPVTLFVKGFNDEAGALDASDAIILDVLSEVLAAENRSSSEFLFVNIDGIDREILNDNNDNAIRLIFNFSAETLQEF